MVVEREDILFGLPKVWTQLLKQESQLCWKQSVQHWGPNRIIYVFRINLVICHNISKSDECCCVFSLLSFWKMQNNHLHSFNKSFRLVTQISSRMSDLKTISTFLNSGSRPPTHSTLRLRDFSWTFRGHRHHISDKCEFSFCPRLHLISPFLVPLASRHGNFPLYCFGAAGLLVTSQPACCTCARAVK